MHYLLYARVSPRGSTWAAEETTVQDQLRDGRAYCLARDPAATFDEAFDEFATANHARMPNFLRALEQLRAGTAPWDAIVFRHIDRVGRSAVEVIQFGAELAARGKYFIAYAMPFPTEPPIGPLILGIFALLAEFERRMCSERTRTRMVAIAKAGKIPYGQPPYGYRRRAPHDNRMEPDPETAPRLREMFERYADGETIAAIARRLGFNTHSVRNCLTRRTYLGVMAYGGQEYPGLHPALVSQDLWQRVQARLPQPREPGAPARRPNRAKRPFPLVGLLRCSCGRWLTAASAHGRSAVYRYYQCTDTERCRRRIPADALEQDLFRALGDLPIRPQVIDRALALYKDRLRETAARAADPEELRRLRADRDRLRRQHAGLLDMAENGLVSAANAADWNDRLAGARERLQHVESRLAALQAIASPDAATIADAAAWARTFRDIGTAIANMTDAPESLAALLRVVVEQVELLPETAESPSPRWRLTLRLTGSPTAVEWQATIARDEPLALMVVGNVAVVVRLVPAA